MRGKDGVGKGGVLEKLDKAAVRIVIEVGWGMWYGIKRLPFLFCNFYALDVIFEIS